MKTMRSKNFRHITYLFALLMLTISGCNTLKYIPEGEKLYTGAQIDIKGKLGRYDKGALEEDLQEVARPKPNKKILGIRLGLWARQRVNRGASTPYSKFIDKKLGEEPVLLSEVDLTTIDKLMKNRLENMGYFYSNINSKKSPGKRTGLTKFVITTGKRLLINEFTVDSLGITLIDSLLGEYARSEKIIKPKEPFSLYTLKEERINAASYLKKKGYYYFNDKYLLFEADSIDLEKPNRVNLKLVVKSSTPADALEQYKIGDIQVYPYYKIVEDSASDIADTAVYQEVEYIQDFLYFFPAKLHPYLLLNEGDLYNEENERYTNRRLNSLETYRYVNTRFQRDSAASGDYGSLDAFIYLSPLKKRSFVAEVQGTSKSNNFVGSALTLEYLNRNIFKGAESFSIKGKIGYEAQITGEDLSGLNSLETGLAAEYRVPRLVSPFNIQDNFRYAIPRTKFRVSYDFLRRAQYFSLNSFLALIGYEWNANAYVTHTINPISLNLINVTRKTAAFQQLLEDNSFLRRSFEQQFIPSLSYSFQYNKLVTNDQRSRFYLLLNTEFAGNIFGLVQGIGGESGTDKMIFGVEYAQYNRFDIDVRNYFDLTQESRLVTRLFTGWGFPYGNSQSLPYSKQYFSGGPNSLRAFRIRSVGPGNYAREDGSSTGSFFDQTGDIKIEGNIEYRFPIYSVFKGAVFTDVGNVWLQNGNEENNDGTFGPNWYNQLALGAGVGIRLDVKFVVVRLDVATPLHKPDQSGNFDWQSEYKFGNKAWRKDNIVWNFAIGYPF